jgi:hypothetical protein
METAAHNRWRSISAVICLFAVAFLYAPHAVAAWMAYGAPCCASGQCPIKEHHHHQTPVGDANQANSNQADSHHMDCGHDMASMMDCSMSCCHHSETPAVASAIFVLPLPFELSAPASFTSGIVSLHFPDSPGSIQPLSPPPRLVSAVA